MTTGKTIALTRWTFVGKVMSLLFSMLSRLVIAFLPRSKHPLISWLQSPSAVILAEVRGELTIIIIHIVLSVWLCFHSLSTYEVTVIFLRALHELIHLVLMDYPFTDEETEGIPWWPDG